MRFLDTEAARSTIAKCRRADAGGWAPSSLHRYPEPESDQDLVLVGSCHGVTVIPRDSLTDYYNGYACAGLVAFALALLVALLAALMGALA